MICFQSWRRKHNLRFWNQIVRWRKLQTFSWTYFQRQTNNSTSWWSHSNPNSFVVAFECKYFPLFLCVENWSHRRFTFAVDCDRDSSPVTFRRTSKLNRTLRSWKVNSDEIQKKKSIESRPKCCLICDLHRIRCINWPEIQTGNMQSERSLCNPSEIMWRNILRWNATSSVGNWKM